MQLGNGERTAAHRALSITEVQRLAFDIKKNYPWDFGDLMNVALTCRAFLEVALDIHWREIYDLRRVFSTWRLSGVVGVGEPVLKNGKSLYPAVWLRDPTPPEWERLAYYTRRIHFMTEDSNSTSVGFLDDFFERFALAAHNRQRPIAVDGKPNTLYPCLEHLTWRCATMYEDQGPELVVSFQGMLGCWAVLKEASRLRRFDGAADADLWPSLLDALSGHDIGRLSELNVRCHPPPDVLERIQPMELTAHSLSQVLRHHHLRDLEIARCLLDHEEVQQSVFQLPTLESLEILESWYPEEIEEEEGGLMVPVHGVSYVPLGAAALSGLRALQGRPLDIRGLFATTVFNQLWWLRVRGINSVALSWSWLRGMLKSVGECCPALAMLELDAQIADLDSNVTDESNPAFTALLHGCSRMVEFELRLSHEAATPKFAPTDFNPTDEDWLNIAQLWPSIKKFEYSFQPIGCYWGGNEYSAPFHPAPRATLESVGNLARNCRELSYLDIPFSSRTGDIDDRGALCLPRSRNLEELVVAQAWIEYDLVAIKATVDYLNRLVLSPTFKILRPWWSDGSDSDREDPRSRRVKYPPTPMEEKRRCKAWKRVHSMFRSSRRNM